MLRAARWEERAAHQRARTPQARCGLRLANAGSETASPRIANRRHVHDAGVGPGTRSCRCREIVQASAGIEGMGQKLATEHDYSRIDKGSANSESQSVEDIRQIIGGGIGGQSAARDTGLDRTSNLLGVQFIDRYFGYFVLPAMPRMCAFQENPLIGFPSRARRTTHKPTRTTQPPSQKASAATYQRPRQLHSGRNTCRLQTW